MDDVTRQLQLAIEVVQIDPAKATVMVVKLPRNADRSEYERVARSLAQVRDETGIKSILISNDIVVQFAQHEPAAAETGWSA